MKKVYTEILVNNMPTYMEPTHSQEQSSGEAEDPGSSRRPSHPMNHSAARMRLRSSATNGHSGFLGKLKGLFSRKSPTMQIGAAGTNGHAPEDASLRGVIESVLGGEGDIDITAIDSEERDLLENVMSFSDQTVSDIMTPRADIVAVDLAIAFDELRTLMAEAPHSRLPLYESSLDDIKGFLHVKDLAQQHFAGERFNLQRIMRQVLFVPPSMKLKDLLVKMRSSSVHIAIVVDEYGGTDGLVTMEDIMEEIVGEIQDEHDEELPEADYVWTGEQTIEADARMEIEVLDSCFGAVVSVYESDEEPAEYETVGGLIFAYLGRVPEKDEAFDYPTGLRITVLDADARTVKRVRITYTPPAEQEKTQEEAISAQNS